jgi:hypothetical protein
VARYLEHDIPIASWVDALATQSVPADLERLLQGHHRVAVATIHNGTRHDQVEPWLRAHARLAGRETFRSSRAEVLFFEPAKGDTLLLAAPQGSRWE